MLDDANVIDQRDPAGALRIAAEQYAQTQFVADVQNNDNDGRCITTVVVAGMGGSALAAFLAKTWLKPELSVPIEIVKTYDVPAYVDEHTLVIASSYSGNTEETLTALEQAKNAGAQLAVVTAGGVLLDRAQSGDIAYVQIPANMQPRMAVIDNLRALTALLVEFGVVSQSKYDEIAACSIWIKEEIQCWTADVTTDKNYAKQLSLHAAGKTPVFYAGSLMSSVAYKWKINWNENAKNVAFWNELPEFNHNEFMGWTSHPVDKPYAVFDLVSHFEHERIQKRFIVSDKLLSGKRPKARTIQLKGDTPIAQIIWASILGDFVSIYVAILNGVDPTPVKLIEKFKHELG